MTALKSGDLAILLVDAPSEWPLGTSAWSGSRATVHDFREGDMVSIIRTGMATRVHVSPVIDGVVSPKVYSLPLKGVAPYAGEGKPPRRLGETPEGKTAITDESLSWVWDDINSYLEASPRKTQELAAWTSICAALDIPGISRVYRVEVGPGVNMSLTARSRTEAEKKASDLLKAPTTVQEDNNV